MASSGVAVKAAQHSGGDALMAALAGFLKRFERQDGEDRFRREGAVSGRHGVTMTPRADA